MQAALQQLQAENIGLQEQLQSAAQDAHVFSSQHLKQVSCQCCFEDSTCLMLWLLRDPEIDVQVEFLQASIAVQQGEMQCSQSEHEQQYATLLQQQQSLQAQLTDTLAQATASAAAAQQEHSQLVSASEVG